MTKLAHVGYVVPETTFNTTKGLDNSFLLSGLQNPSNIILIFGSLITIIVIVYLASKLRFFKNLRQNICEKNKSYRDVFPWITRLSLGIALIGAGSSYVLVSPLIESKLLAGIQILIGFLLLTGFLLTPAMLIAIGFFVYALTLDFYMLGNLEFISLAITYLILGDSKPGVDDLIGINLSFPLEKFKKHIPLILRLGISTSLIFLAVYEKFLNPNTSAEVVKMFNMTSIIPVSIEMWILGVGLVEISLGLLLLFGYYTRVTSAFTFVVLSLSFFFFGENVYSHITIFATLSILFVTGGGLGSIDNLLKNKKEAC